MKIWNLVALFKRFQPPAPTLVTPVTQQNLLQLQLKSARELVDAIELQNLLRSIRRLVAIPDEHWRTLYQPVLDRFLVSAQLAPASAAHHHAGPGGLAAHTLESVELALQMRKALVLPRNADPDTTARQEHVWTYALFVAVLLHDLGKLSTTSRIRMVSGEYWTPYTKLDALKGKPYQIEFVTAPYKQHVRIANASLHLLPKAGITWLTQFPNILAHVCAWLYGDLYEAGIIGELAQKADGESVARNLRNNGDRVRFPNAPAIPLVDRLIIGLRQLLERNELKLNGNGADGWFDGTYLWLVCGTVAKKLIEFLRQEGMTQIPTDHNRIFDTLQEHNYILPTASGKAIWHTVVSGPVGTYRFELTMLKFEIARMLPPTRRPSAFGGIIDVIERTETGSAPGSSSPIENAPAPCKSTATAAAVATTRTPASEQLPVSTESEPDFQENLPDWMHEESNGTESTNAATRTAPKYGSDFTSRLEEVKTSETVETVSVSHGLETDSLSFDDIRPRHLDDNIGQFFMDWLARMLRHGKLPVNRQDAVIHIVPEGALVVSPRVFKEFISFFDLYHRENGNELTNDEAARHLQKKVEKLRLNIKNTTGMSVHTYKINGPNRSSRVSGFLFDPLKIFGHVLPPQANPHLSSHGGDKK